MLAIQQPSSAFNNNAPSFPWVLDNIFPEGDSSLGMGDSGQGDDPIKRDEGGAWGYGDYAWDSFLMQARPLEGAHLPGAARGNSVEQQGTRRG